MEFKKPKQKKNSAPKRKLPVPLKNEKNIVGVFNGQFVTIYDLDSMLYLYELGAFGKGSLSKGGPNYHIKKDDIPRIMFQHQFENQTKWKASSSYNLDQNCLGFVGSDMKLSLQSVNDFFQSSFLNDEQKLWGVSMKTCVHHPDVSFLEFKTEDDYKDENFSKFVNSILQSRQIRVANTLNSSTDEVIVLSNTSGSPSANINARLEKLPFGLKESLNLNLEESFYLKSELKCLNIVDLNFSEIQVPDLWQKFNAVDKNFIERYITYQYCRAKGWVVRSGLKFGGDYLLYKDGPAHYHASFLVKVLDKRKKFTWRELIGMNRLVETFNKDLLLSNVLPIQKESHNESYPSVLQNYSVQQVLMRRWFPSKERQQKEDKTSS